MASSRRRGGAGGGGLDRVTENWERLVRAALKHDRDHRRAGGAGPSTAASAAGVGLATAVPPSLGRTTNIEQILQAADDIEDEDPNVARIFCEQAYSMAQNLDPSSEGRGVLQFKTGLASVIKQKLAKKDGASIDRQNGIQDLWNFYLKYKSRSQVDDMQREQERLRESGTFSTDMGAMAVEMKKIYGTLRALLDVLEVFLEQSPTHRLGRQILAEIRRMKRSDAALRGELTPYNIVPLDAPSVANIVGFFPELTVSTVVLQNHMKLLHEYQQLMISVVGIFLTLQAVQTYGGIARFKSTTPIELAGLSMLLFFIGLDLGLPYYMGNIFVDLETYIRTVAVVLEAYVLLLLISTSYIEIAIYPVVILVFIGALCSKLRENRSFQYDHRREVTLQNCAKSAEKLMKMAMIPYCLQLSFVIWTQLKGQQGGIFIHSHFLLFFSSMLGALAVMVATPPVVVSPGAVQVLPVLHKICIVMLLITTHTMAAEWVGEDFIMVCMPELIAVMIWFTIHCVDAGHAMSINSVTSLKSEVIILSSVVAILAYLTTIYASDRIILRPGT